MDYLSKKLDKQKEEIESGICEDIAVYSKNSRYWRKSREIREQKLLARKEDEEDDNDYTTLSYGKRGGGVIR